MDELKGLKEVTDLRLILADEIHKIREGKTTPANVNAITNASGKILSSIKLEMEYNKLHGRVPWIGFLGEEKAKKLKG